MILQYSVCCLCFMCSVLLFCMYSQFQRGNTDVSINKFDLGMTILRGTVSCIYELSQLF